MESPLIGVEKALELLAGGDEDQGGVTVAELAQQWLTWKARDVEARTIADYRRDFDNWVDPFFGDRAAAYVTELDVQEWVDRHLAQLSPKSVADRHALLHGIFKWAATKKRALVPHNPCLETDLPKRRKSPPKGLTIPEWHRLKAAFYEVDVDAADLALFMASTGWRIGEATAVTVQGVEDGDPMFVTMWQVNRKGVGIAAGGKSAAAARRIKVSAECAAMVRRRMVGKAPSDLVFTNPHSPLGVWEPSTFRNRWWRKAVERAGLADRAPTPHWLRHTHVMLCHAAGMTLAEIQRRVGHEDIKTTIGVYGRMIDDADEETMEKLDRLLAGDLPVIGEVVTTPTLPRSP